jgi:hypothetical protein
MRRTDTGARPRSSRWITVLALLAFFLQNLAVQTHIHEQVPVAKATTALPTPSKTPFKSQDPVDQCRLCQELVHAGAFITPSAAPIPADPAYVAAVFVALTGPTASFATAFAWQSRAPPRR